jgi:hypothetical protein
VYAAGWLVAVVAAVAVGIVTVTAVGASVRGRGPVGQEVPPATATVPPTAGPHLVEETISGEFGGFRVGCDGVYAVGVRALPDEAAGWRVVSFEPGPDDDVDAVFARGGRSIELEVFCNQGRPTLAEQEEHELADE